MYYWVLNALLRNFRGCSTRGTSHWSCCRMFSNNCMAKESRINYQSATPRTLLKNQIFVDVFLIGDYEYAALRKELLIALFFECFKIANMEKRYLYILSILGKICLRNAFFCQFLADRRLSTLRSKKEAAHCSFHGALYKMFGKVLLINFINTYINFPRHCAF